MEAVYRRGKRVMNRTDPIIRSLLSCRIALRRNSAFESAFPLLSYGVPCIGALAFYVNSSTIISLGFLTFYVLLISTACWTSTGSISLQHAASAADGALSLNDMLSSYLQFAGENDPAPFKRLHLNSVAELFPKGVEWRPVEPELRRMCIVSLAMFMGLAAVFTVRDATEPHRSATDPVPESTRVALAKASTQLSSPQNRELSVSLEQFSKTASPVTQKDREKIIEQLRNIQREINSSEAEFAGEYLSELLSKSAQQNSTMNAISEALRSAQWQRASQLARNVSNADGRGLSGREQEVLEALREHHAQVKSSEGTTKDPEPNSETLRRKLASLARQYSPKETSDMLKTLNDVRESLAEIGQPSPSNSKSQGSSSTESAKSGPLIDERNTTGKSRVLGAKAVNPFIAAGPGQSLAAIMDLQDTGLSTIFSEPTQNKNFKESNPVISTEVPYSRRELVKAYFQHRNSDDLIQGRKGSDE